MLATEKKFGNEIELAAVFGHVHFESIRHCVFARTTTTAQRLPGRRSGSWTSALHLRGPVTMSALRVTGEFDQATQTQAREWMNDNWDTAGFRKKKLSGSSFGTGSTKALQTYLNKVVPGCRLVVDGKDSSSTVKMLRKFLNNNWDKAKFRAKKLQLVGRIKDGLENNPGTVKALQTYLNSVYFPEDASESDDANEAPAEVRVPYCGCRVCMF